ncbi:MAG: histidinol dehydrogenase [Cyclobacteriaceae bacterium]
MKFFEYTDEKTLVQELKRPTYDHSKIEKIVQPILDKVKRGGDQAVRKFALEYDHVELDDLWVDQDMLIRAEDEVKIELKDAIKQAKKNITKFHKAQHQEPFEMEVMKGVNCARRSIPIQKVGLYIPGGTAPLFSTVLMLGVPAQLAGCKEIILATPTNKYGEVNPVVLYTANLLGIHKILKVGGAQAIAAMAYGTETATKVDKIFGPGNQYVTAAKQIVSRDTVAIDMPAGPSEVMVVADETTNPDFAAMDLLSQAEHGVDSQAILVSKSRKSILAIEASVNRLVEELPRKAIAKKALEASISVLVKSDDELVKTVNVYGPEHLIFNTEEADSYVDRVVNAGSVFIGPYTPESMGDYASGTNHTLPTNGWANAYSGVSLDSFMKKITYQKITKEGIKALGPVVEHMAEAEQLEAHKQAVTLRLQSLKK